MADSTQTPKPYSIDPVLYLYTSLTAGSSHIITATSRLETILKANRIPFRGLDIATDEKARMLWGRRAGKDESGRQRKLPGLVQEGFVIGDIVEIEEWNEYGELKQHVKIVNDGTPVIMTPPPILPQMGEKKVVAPAPPSPAPAPAAPAAPAQPKTVTKAPESPAPAKDDDSSSIISLTESMRRLGQEAAKKAKDTKTRSIRSSLERSSFEGKGRPESSSKPGTPHSTKTASSVSLEPKASGAETSLPSKNAARQSIASTTSKGAADDHTSLQSPNSTAWKPTDIDPPIHSYRGSDIAEASPEEIKKVEQDEAIPEADEESSEESSEETSDEDEDEDDEDDEDSDEEEVKKEVKEKEVEKPKSIPQKDDDSDDSDDDEDDDEEDDEDEDESDDDSDDERNGHAGVQAPAEKERGAEEAAREPQKPKRTD